MEAAIHNAGLIGEPIVNRKIRTHFSHSMSAAPSTTGSRRNHRLRDTLKASQKDAACSSVMNGICDNFLSPFAVSLHATLPQIAWLTAIPQFIGALLQLPSVLLGMHRERKQLIVTAAILQAAAVGLLALLAWQPPFTVVSLVIASAVVYQAAGNVVQPHWRALMGNLVPERRRGRFFARRTRLTMMVTFSAFLAGGWILQVSTDRGLPHSGFALVFMAAAIGRVLSARYLAMMHDPSPLPPPATERALHRTSHAVREALRNRTFRNYSLFFAAMQGAVAVGSPFFTVYLLRVLGYSYVEFTLTTASAIFAQFLMLPVWGKLGDQLGNRVVMLATGLVIPILPALWIASDTFWPLVGAQLLSGIAWSGFSLSTANYLYDLRPHQTHFAAYAAFQSGISATAVLLGALAGGYLAAALPTQISLGGNIHAWQTPLYGVFAISMLLRLLVVCWFLPRAEEPRIRRRPQLRELIVRVARFNPISGVALDWVTVARKPATNPVTTPEARQNDTNGARKLD
ncbi:MAG: MFS transporter [Gammaproteobacteria bacterium]|nr:MFS transporter [Gammaproteobacteria bacterium]